jgi:sugar phosphate isomerase/epimerase
MDRRSFLETVTAATLLSRKLGWAAGDRKIEKIGLQLYTVRSEMKKDFAGTLGKVANIGYREVEFAGYFDHSPQEIRKLLDSLGLAAPSAHVAYDTLGDTWPGVIEAAKGVGHSYIVCPWIPEQIRNRSEGWKQAAETFNRAGEASKKAGIQFAYHNHNFEFAPVNGKLPYDMLLAETDPDLVKMEMDLCWITVGGQDPLAYFSRYPGRFPMVHVKDVKKIPERTASDKGPIPMERIMPDMTDVGRGAIDWKRIFAQSNTAGIKHYFVEQDEPKSPFDSIKNSYAYLKELRFSAG